MASDLEDLDLEARVPVPSIISDHLKTSNSPVANCERQGFFFFVGMQVFLVPSRN